MRKILAQFHNPHPVISMFFVILQTESHDIWFLLYCTIIPAVL